MKNERGAGVVEFVLVLPWLVGFVLALVWLGVWIMEGHLMHYAAYKKARLTGFYQDEKAEREARSVYPKTILTEMPVHFSLSGMRLDLFSQGEEDRWRQPKMDNPIPFCGREGSYVLCGY